MGRRLRIDSRLGAGQRSRAETARLAQDGSRWSLIVAVAGALGFAGVLAVVRRKRTEALDLAVTMRLQAVRHAFLARIMTAVSWPGFSPQSRIIPPLLIALEWLSRYRLEALIQGLAWGTTALATIFKSFMDRPRPVAGTDLRVVAADLGGTSFPSGHVLSYVGTYGWLAVVVGLKLQPVWLRRIIVGCLASVVALVGPSRISPGSPLGNRRHGLVSVGVQLPRRPRDAVSTAPVTAGVVVTATSLPPVGQRTVRVLWNPNAGRKAGIPTNTASRESLTDLLGRFGLGSELLETKSEDHARSLVHEAVAAHYDVVVAAGGDGSIGLVAGELRGTTTALGILPLGSIMNIPRMLDIPRDLEGAAGVLRDGFCAPSMSGIPVRRRSTRRRPSGCTRRYSATCPRSTRVITRSSGGLSWLPSATAPRA